MIKSALKKEDALKEKGVAHFFFESLEEPITPPIKYAGKIQMGQYQNNKSLPPLSLLKKISRNRNNAINPPNNPEKTTL